MNYNLEDLLAMKGLDVKIDHPKLLIRIVYNCAAKIMYDMTQCYVTVFNNIKLLSELYTIISFFKTRAFRSVFSETKS